MFIYEKHNDTLDKSTLNLVFNGQLPTSNPDVVVTNEGMKIKGLTLLKDFLTTRGCKALFNGKVNLTYDTLSRIIKYDDTSNVTNMTGMFQGCSSLTTIPLLNTSNTTDMTGMFIGCTSLIKLPQLDTHSVINMYQMFGGCSNITSIPLLDTSSVINMSGMFVQCSLLESIPKFDTSKVTDMSLMFGACSSLISIPALDTRNVTNMYQMCKKCTSLQTIQGLDMRSVTDATEFVNGCSALTNITLKNVKISLTISDGTTYGHLITVDSLIGIIRELIDTGEELTLTIGQSNIEKIANIYVKTITITDEMRQLDEFIDSKHPFEVCESTDDGAQLITDYITTKHWALN